MSDTIDFDPVENIMILQPVNADEVGKRRPGRPRTKVNPQDVKPDQVYAPPTKKLETEKERSDKQRKKLSEVESLTKKIVEDLNDTLIQGLATIGIPPEMLYVSGGPKIVSVDSNFTPLANLFCVNPNQAHWMARGWVEAKEFPAIAKFVGSGDSEGPSYGWLILGGLGLLSYATQLARGMKYLKEFTEQMKQAQIVAEQNGATTTDFPGED